MKPLNEFPGIGLDYDAKRDPFYEAMILENLRSLKSKPVGKLLLTAIGAAKPSYRGSCPQGINVLISPPTDKQMVAPGLQMSRDFSTGATTVKIRDNQAFLDWDNRVQGGMVAGGLAKTLGEPWEGTGPSKDAAYETNAGKASTGTVCRLKYSNIEILSKQGTWLHPHITMGHELIHCLHFLHGIGKHNIKQEEYQTVGIKGYEDSPITENKLRQEHKFGLRKKYFADD
jgi:hypothetical protein